ncbi:cystatin [Acipenser ruthenus]|uniref:cystatin n=1 Tax=Acipenser ruthenus TaxID=7906 RepID=UPI00145A3816|nr:cystatin [Acipenser ruthenus]
MAVWQYLFLFSIISVLSVSKGEEHVEEVVVEEAIKVDNVHPYGAPIQADPSSPEIQRVANAAVAEYNMINKRPNFFKLVNVKTAETQVINAIKYILNVEIRRTKCKKPNAVDLESCVLGKKTLNCYFEVHFHPSDNSYKIMYTDCKK